MLETVRRLAWIACCIYATIPAFWLMVHPYVEFWRKRARSPYRVLLPTWLAMWVVCGIGTAPWRDVAIYKSSAAFVPALALFCAGIWIYAHSGNQFSLKQLSGLPEIQPSSGQKLTTSGLRQRVRHPIYLAHLMEMLAWSIGTGLIVCFALTAFALVTGWVMVTLEDRELERRFGDEFREYRRRVPAILPRL